MSVIDEAFVAATVTIELSTGERAVYELCDAEFRIEAPYRDVAPPGSGPQRLAKAGPSRFELHGWVTTKASGG